MLRYLDLVKKALKEQDVSLPDDTDTARIFGALKEKIESWKEEDKTSEKYFNHYAKGLQDRPLNEMVYYMKEYELFAQNLMAGIANKEDREKELGRVKKYAPYCGLLKDK